MKTHFLNQEQFDLIKNLATFTFKVVPHLTSGGFLVYDEKQPDEPLYHIVLLEKSNHGFI